jgi:hypothetical protein
VEDEPVTPQQVIVTIILGAMPGSFITLLVYLSSPSSRDRIGWIALLLIGGGIVLLLYLRYAPSWLRDWFSWPFDW